MGMSSFRIGAEVSYLFLGLTLRDNVKVEPSRPAESLSCCSGDLRAHGPQLNDSNPTCKLQHHTSPPTTPRGTALETALDSSDLRSPASTASNLGFQLQPCCALWPPPRSCFAPSASTQPSRAFLAASAS